MEAAGGAGDASSRQPGGILESGDPVSYPDGSGRISEDEEEICGFSHGRSDGTVLAEQRLKNNL